MAGIAYYILSKCLVALHGQQSTLAKAVGKDNKGIISVIVYIVAIPVAFYNGTISLYFYALVAIMWFLPDRRIEKKLAEEN
jgi:uncharacterized membrane protein